MKNYLLGIVTISALVALFGFISYVKGPDVPDKEWIIAPRFLTLQEGVSKEEARNWLINEYLLLYREFPGWNAMLGEPLRSGGWGTENNVAKEKGDFVI